jgi:hypothetical protein
MKTLMLAMMLMLSSCWNPPTEWTFHDGTEEQRKQGMVFVEATIKVMGNLKNRMAGGDVWFCDTQGCMINKCGFLCAGCIVGAPHYWSVILTEPPRGPDLLLSAMSHELCHQVTAEYDNTARIDECARLVNDEVRAWPVP